MSNANYIKYKEGIKKWQEEHKQYMCEYSKNYIKERCTTDEEFRLKRNEQVKLNMQRMRAEQKAKKIAEGWIPSKRGPKFKKNIPLPSEPSIQ